MFFTGFTRFSSDVQRVNNETSLEEKKAKLDKMYKMVDKAEKILCDKNCDLDDFGRLLDESWKLKKQTGKGVSTDVIDKLYAKGIKAGALGGKLLGAGGGGFLIFYVKPEKQKAVKKAMKDLLYIPFEFDNEGATIIHYSPETYEPKVEED